MTFTGDTLPIDAANIDTDQIIPAFRLTGITKTGVGQWLFDGRPGANDLLARHPHATIVVAGENFGCGSSREHAVWALTDRGFRAVIAPSFARIFEENAYNNGLVPIVATGEGFDAAMRAARIAVDVANETFTTESGERVRLALDPLRKRFLLEGGYMEYLASKRPAIRAWLSEREGRCLA